MKYRIVKKTEYYWTFYYIQERIWFLWVCSEYVGFNMPHYYSSYNEAEKRVKELMFEDKEEVVKEF